MVMLLTTSSSRKDDDDKKAVELDGTAEVASALEHGIWLLVILISNFVLTTDIC